MDDKVKLKIAHRNPSTEVEKIVITNCINIYNEMLCIDIT